MYKIIKYLILIIFTILISIEDLKYKKIEFKFFCMFYLLSFLYFLGEIIIRSIINRQSLLIIDYIKPILIPLFICICCFIGSYKNIIPIGEGDILFIFILFLYFKTLDAILIILSSLIIIFMISIFIIFKNIISKVKFKNKTLPFIPAFIPGIIYFIGVYI